MRSDLISVIVLAALTTPIVSQDQATPFPAAQLVGGSYHRFDLAVDLDLDGHVDYLGGYDTKVHWHKNRGDGLVSSSTVLINSPASQWVDFCRTDLDNDGHQDAVCFVGYTACAILARPGGPVVHTSPVTYAVSSLRVGDFQGDGDPELLASTNNRILVYAFNTTTNAFDLKLTYWAAAADCFAADLDGDGDDEIWRYNASWIWVLDVDAAWNTTQVQTVANVLADELYPITGDVDGDGDTDLVLFNAMSNGTTYSLLRRNAAGQLIGEPIATGGPATHLGDVDGDGDLDGLCCGGGTGPYANDHASEFMISLNDGTGQFAPGQPVAGIGGRILAGCVDVDGDGDRDLVGGRAIIFNPGDITEAFPMQGGWPMRYEPLADADRDLDADLNLVGGSFRFDWSEARGDGSYFPYFATIPNGSWNIKGTRLVGDFDGDGDVDGLLQDETTNPVQVRLYRNVGGQFGLPIDAAPPGLSMLATSNYSSGNGYTWENQWSFAHDWDADGDLDCVVVDEASGWTKLFRNGGNGYFTAGPTLPAGMLVTGVGDFTGDGLPDLLAGTPGDLSLLHYLPQTGSGFGAPVTISNSIRRDERPGIVDIDGDGDVDILTSTQAGGALLRNTGGGQFAQEPQAFESHGLTHWSFADVDENGTLDAVSRQPYYRGGMTSSVILQNANGTFAEPAVLLAEVSALTDADKDGDLDMVGKMTVKNRTATGSFGTLRQYGFGSHGTLSVKPRINDIGITAPGNPMIMRVSGMRGGAAGLWVLGVGDAHVSNTPLPGMILYVDQILAVTPFVADGTPGAGGEGTWTLPWQMMSGLGGWQLSSQAFCMDPNAIGGWSQTNGKVMTLPN